MISMYIRRHNKVADLGSYFRRWEKVLLLFLCCEVNAEFFCVGVIHSYLHWRQSDAAAGQASASFHFMVFS